MAGPRGRSRGGAPSVEARLEAVRALRADPEAPEARAALARALADASNLVVAAAADVVAEAQLAAQAGALAAAFDRFMDRPAETDRMCRAKVAIVRALLTVEHDAVDVFRRSARHVQLEAVWRGHEDTAPELRGLGVLGVVRARAADAALVAAERLADRSHVTRAAVARALAEVEPVAALPLLRYKIAVGDEEPEVIGACFGSLLELAPGTALPLGERLLAEGGEAVAEAVALALGESRRREALPILRAFADRGPVESRRVAFVALALLRMDEAIEHLIATVARGRAPEAEDALRALAHFRHDERLAGRVRAAVAARGDRRLAEVLERGFPR
jgi:hypothetical protein